MKPSSSLADNPASSLAKKWKMGMVREGSSCAIRSEESEADGEAEVRQLEPTAWIRSTPALVGLGLLPIVLNAFLAIVNAHVTKLGFVHAALAEVLVLIVAGTVVLASPKTSRDVSSVSLFAFFCVSTVLISLLTGRIQLDTIRNVTIVSIFTLLGLRYSYASLQTTVNYSLIIVVIILLIEIFSVNSYVSIFEPAQYFASTRGLNVAEYNETGLFGNALGWEGRFSILNILDHRGASLFLEQVSLGNFAMIATLYIYTFWADLRNWERMGILITIILILIVTASRAATTFFVIAPILALVAPKLHRFVPLAVMPLSLLTALMLYYVLPPTIEDNLAGRIGYTMRNLSNLSLSGYLGANATTAGNYPDSGYVYFIASSSIFGLIAYWLFVSLFSAGANSRAKVCTLLAAVYIFMNLLVSGTSIFSLKTASLLWLIVGQVVMSIPAREQNSRNSFNRKRVLSFNRGMVKGGI